jgi:hypothetical protein
MVGEVCPSPTSFAHQREVPMLLARVKTIAWVLLVAFLIYAIFKSPDQAAAIVRTAWGGVLDGLQAIGRFFDALLGNGASSNS